MIVTSEAPYVKRQVPQCTRCEKYGHTKNYYRHTPRCVKRTAAHQTSECPRNVKDDKVKCVNCNENHPANYRGCIIHKQLQQKLYPQLRERNTTTRTIQTGVTYAQIVQGRAETSQKSTAQPNSTNIPQSANDLTEPKQMMKTLMDQKGTLINLIPLTLNTGK